MNEGRASSAPTVEVQSKTVKSSQKGLWEKMASATRALLPFFLAGVYASSVTAKRPSKQQGGAPTHTNTSCVARKERVLAGGCGQQKAVETSGQVPSKHATFSLQNNLKAVRREVKTTAHTGA